MISSHDFAKILLELPNLPIVMDGLRMDLDFKLPSLGKIKMTNGDEKEVIVIEIIDCHAKPAELELNEIRKAFPDFPNSQRC